MIYTDPLFIAFFVIAWIVNAILLRFSLAAREWWLIFCSLVVIASFGFKGLELFIMVLTVNYIVASYMSHQQYFIKSLLLFGLISGDIIVLGAYKYAHFFEMNFHSNASSSTASLAIPIAISFYTFHLISFHVDLYKGKIQMTSFRHYLFYLSFFPHVIAGPIVRAWQLVPQIGRVRRVVGDNMMGLHYVIVGYFLKAVVANNIGASIDPVWEGTTPFTLTMGDRWTAAFLYYCQIYGDFAGYSLIAMGMARLLGFHLPANFRSPMLATSLQEFWQRWHITLSRWLRDYLYFSLGGSHVSWWRIGLNVMITMVLGGLWHGAGWGFIIWGAIHGGGIVLERIIGLRHWKNRLRALLLTQIWVTLAWVFFRFSDLDSALVFVKRMFSFGRHWSTIHPPLLGALIFAVPIILHHCVPYLLKKMGRRHVFIVLGVLSGAMLILDIIIYSPAQVFIYFKF